MKSYFCTNKDCKYYLKPCSITFDEDDDGYMGPVLCKCCRGLAMTKESLSTANLGRAGVSIEAEMAKKERLKYYKAGFLRGYELAMQDVATLANDNKNSAKRRYADQGITNIIIHEPGEE